MVFAGLAFLGYSHKLGWLFLWLVYFSIAKAGIVFFIYIWDVLLLEVGFLAFLLVGFQKGIRLKKYHPLPLWLLRFVLFKLMLGMGLVKILESSGSWLTLEIMPLFYEYQPLPTFFAWYLFYFPAWFHQVSVVLTLFIELVVPFFIFMNRPFRITAFILICLLQIMIMIAGNFGFFNLLTMVLALLVLDDHSIRPLFARLRVQSWMLHRNEGYHKAGIWLRLGFFAYSLVAGLLYLYLVVNPGRLETVHETNRFFMHSADEYTLAEPLVHFLKPGANYYISNPYALFGAIPRSRIEIYIEGSHDKKTWKRYRYKYKANSIEDRPPVYAPHHARLDHQMYYEGYRHLDPGMTGYLSHFLGNRWMHHLCLRLFQGSKDVSALFADNPFESDPPVWLRFRYYKYRFSSPSEKEKGQWWQSALLNGRYLKTEPFTIEQLSSLP